MTHFVCKPLPFLALTFGLMAPVGHALAAGDQADLDRQYEKDRQACVAMQGSVASREACLREAGAVRQSARNGAELSEATPSELERNARARCEVHPDGANRDACLRMAEGEGASQGSVEKGGIFRETVLETTPLAGKLPLGKDEIPGK